MDKGMWPEEPHTQDLLDRARQGEPEAVEPLLGKHREPLRRLIEMRLDSSPRALGDRPC
jgi:RNA polymerase sigma-70 factor (ECF subfamily)